MSGVSSKSRIVGVRLSNVTIAKIEAALEHPSNANSSICDYCKTVVERHAFRHSLRKYRRGR